MTDPAGMELHSIGDWRWETEAAASTRQGFTDSTARPTIARAAPTPPTARADEAEAAKEKQRVKEESQRKGDPPATEDGFLLAPPTNQNKIRAARAEPRAKAV